MTLLCLQLFQFSFPSFLEMLQYFSSSLTLARLIWCYYLGFPELTNLFVNLCQPPHTELCLGFFALVLETWLKISFTSSTDMLAFSVVSSCFSGSFGFSLIALVSLFNRSSFFPCPSNPQFVSYNLNSCLFNVLIAWTDKSDTFLNI